MPEGVETLQQYDFIMSLFKGPLHEYSLVEVKKITNRFKFDIKTFQTALDKPISSIEVKGKFYFLRFGGEVDVVCHHGMDGWWSSKQENSSHIEFIFMRNGAEENEDVNGVVFLYFNNLEHGDFQVFHNEPIKLQQLKADLAGGFIGVDKVTLEKFLLSLDYFTPRKRLRDILFDQHAACSGLGNYLIAEIMHEMRLHPMVKLGSLNKDMRVRLFETCERVVGEFYERKREKVVYKKEFDPKGRKVEALTVGSRVAYWVPDEQIIQ